MTDWCAKDALWDDTLHTNMRETKFAELVEQKNHAFLLDAFAKLLAARPDAVLVLVGDGPLLPDLLGRARKLGVLGNVVFLEARDDVPRLIHAFDVFAMPSLFEGLGLSLIEAQAAGIPCVISDKIPNDAVILDAVTILPTTCASRWAETLVEMVGTQARLDARAEKFDLSRQRGFLLSLFESSAQ